VKTERQISDEMLVKYLLGEASETESQQVAEWIGKSAENRTKFQDFTLIWKQSRLMMEVSPVDENAAWERFRQRTLQSRPVSKNIAISPRKWLKVAAVLFLMAGGSWLANYMVAHSNYQASVAQKEQPESKATIIQPQSGSQQASITSEKPVVIADVEGKKTTPVVKHVLKRHTRKMMAVATAAKPVNTFYTTGLFSQNKSNKFICNNTPCPIEICISQTLKCKNDQPSAISTCSTLEPDQSGQLHYKAMNKIAKNCKTTVDEITITRMSTGEAIILNDHSTPSTAQNFFNHITGKQKGNVVAGVFHTDCNNHADDCGLTFESSYGNLILQ
jgi:hypothetical protein